YDRLLSLWHGSFHLAEKQPCYDRAAKRYQLDQPNRRIMDKHIADHKPETRNLRHGKINKDDPAAEHFNAQGSVGERNHEAGSHCRPDDFQKFTA
ncbi:MAG: hypothetical protein OXH71_05465, partial [Candidatus Dadabacteria bacterium]|nr:hypothetical protein [Candidatus Dadabacteria bacterium]